jgi:hypothetical protein
LVIPSLYQTDIWSIETVQKYEHIRFEYDVALTHFHQWEESERSKTTKSKQYLHAQEEMEKCKEKYEKIRNDLSTKIDTVSSCCIWRADKLA